MYVLTYFREMRGLYSIVLLVQELVECDHVPTAHGWGKQAHCGPAELHDAHTPFSVSHDQDGLVGVNWVEPKDNKVMMTYRTV